MDLNKIYSPKRLDVDQTQDTRSDYQRDFDRIIFSSAFRRLQNKTQVFPLPGSVFVHNRLTHSLEVASVGRSLGSLAGEFISKNYQLTDESKHFYKYNLYDVISSACLCHDVGNPAFGHSGEDAIASYFQRKEFDESGQKTAFRERFTDKEWTDFIHFEGNANAIRILTQKQTGKAHTGLGLTFATLASILKYPCESSAKDGENIHRKKFGFFQTEQDNFLKIAKETQMIPEEGEFIVYKRHPFVWLVEAADDICYNIIDLEDSHRLGIIDHDKCKDLLIQLIHAFNEKNGERVKTRMNSISDKNERIAYLRAKSIGQLISSTIEVYKEQFDLILEGKLEHSLLESLKNFKPKAVSDVLDEIKDFSIKNIYNHYSVVEIENAGFHLMNELLSYFINPVLSENPTKADKKAIELIPNQFLYKEESDYKKVMGILDFVSGMTDNFAAELYRKIKGIEMGMRR